MIEETDNKPKSLIVIFGATGDLAKRKLYPSIYRLYKNQNLSEDFAVIGVARREWSNEIFRDNVKQSLENLSENDSETEEFSSHFYYHPFDVTDKESYQSLNDLMESLEDTYQTEGNRVFYLAMAPNFFGTITVHLKEEGLTDTSGWKRLVIEKPFGHDFASAEILNNQLRQSFEEHEIYRIDHYLGKQMIQNIEAIRFANAIFEPLWNNQYISNIQITSSETVGVGDRGGYYEKSGALRDMVQNHMLQMVSLLAMEPPINLTPEEIRSEKIKVFRSLRQYEEKEVFDHFFRGQYDAGTINGEEVIGYRDHNYVDQDSNTETYVAGKVMIDNFRWSGVPFYIRTGKRMAQKTTKIVVQFKELPMNLYKSQKEEETGPNLLVIHIQPDEGISLHLNVKKFGLSGETAPIKLQYCNNCMNGMNTPEAYETLLFDIMNGDTTNFTHWDEVALSWKFIDTISKAWSHQKAEDFPNYDAGSMGPDKVEHFIARDGFRWWPVSDEVHLFE